MTILIKRGYCTVPNIKNAVSAILLSYPDFKSEDGVKYKLDGFVQTENGFEPIYVETDEVSESEALEILLGGAS